MAALHYDKTVEMRKLALKPEELKPHISKARAFLLRDSPRNQPTTAAAAEERPKRPESRSKLFPADFFSENDKLSRPLSRNSAKAKSRQLEQQQRRQLEHSPLAAPLSQPMLKERQKSAAKKVREIFGVRKMPMRHASPRPMDQLDIRLCTPQFTQKPQQHQSSSQVARQLNFNEDLPLRRLKPVQSAQGGLRITKSRQAQRRPTLIHNLAVHGDVNIFSNLTHTRRPAIEKPKILKSSIPMKIPLGPHSAREINHEEATASMRRLGAGASGLKRTVYRQKLFGQNNIKKAGNTYYPVVNKSRSEPSFRRIKVKRASSPERILRSTANFGTPRISVSSSISSTRRSSRSSSVRSREPRQQIFSKHSGISYSHSTRTNASVYRGKQQSYIFREVPLPEHIRLFYKGLERQTPQLQPQPETHDHLPLYTPISKSRSQVLLQNPYSGYYVIPGGGTHARNLEHLVQTNFPYVTQINTFENMGHSHEPESPRRAQSPPRAPREFALDNGFENTFKPMPEGPKWGEDEPQHPVNQFGQALVAPKFREEQRSFPMSKVSEIDESKYDSRGSAKKQSLEWGPGAMMTFEGRR